MVRHHTHTAESQLLHDIRLALGRERDLVIFRNQVGACSVDGRHIRYGLAPGSPDIVGILGPAGRWFCLEVKTAVGRLSAEQRQWHAMALAHGAFVATVRSVEDAVAALAAARDAS